MLNIIPMQVCRQGALPYLTIFPSWRWLECGHGKFSLVYYSPFILLLSMQNLGPDGVEEIVSSMGPELTADLVREFGPAFTADLVRAFGPKLTCQIVRHFGPKLTGESLFSAFAECMFRISKLERRVTSQALTYTCLDYGIE